MGSTTRCATRGTRSSHVSPLPSARIKALLATYQDEPGSTRFTPTLIHQDLGSGHLPLDPRTGDLTAVLDWGDVTIGDLAQNFCGLPDAWFPTLPAHYGGAVDPTFTARVAFYRALGPYHALVFGLRTGGEPFIAQGLAEPRAAVK